MSSIEYEIEKIFTKLAQGDDIVLSLLVALAIVLVGFAFKYLIVKLVEKIINKSSKHKKFNWQTTFAKVLKGPLGFFIVSTSIIVALTTLPLGDAVLTFFIKVYRSVFVGIIGYAFYRLEHFYVHLLKNINKKLNYQSSLALNKFFVKTIRVVIVMLTIVMILSLFGYDVSTFVAGLGISGLAISLAAKDTLSNLIAGITLIIDKPFEVGDRIKTNGIDGIVEEISFRTTRLKTLNQEFVTVPNSSISQSPIINLYRIDHLRNVMVIGCTYSTTAAQLKALVDEVTLSLKQNSDVMNEDIMVSVEGFGASSIDVGVAFVTQTGTLQEFVKVRESINLEIMGIMEKLKIDFAFPSQSLYFETPIKVESVDEQ